MEMLFWARQLKKSAVHFFLYKQPEPQKLPKFFAVFKLKVAWNTIYFSKFDQKTVEKSVINTIFKQLVISEPQKFFSSAWALVAYQNGCLEEKCIDKIVF